MLYTRTIKGLALVGVAALILAQAVTAMGQGTFTGQWKSIDGKSSDESPASTEPTRPAIVDPEVRGIAFPPGPSSAPRELSGTGSAVQDDQVRQVNAYLPAGQGQVWREYDLSGYTMHVTSTERPEQAVVDWILRETGYEAWHGDTVSVLSASPRKLRVYHTPEVQAVVSRIVDRFVGSQATSQTFGLRIMSVNNPNWRAKVQSLLHPVAVQTPGIQAWVLRKEDAAVLMAELRRRNDYREQSSPYMIINNGQTSMINFMTPKTYVRDVVLQPNVWPGFQPEAGQIDQGLALEMCPLLSLDAASIDATIKCTVTQVEKMVPVVLEVPASPASPGRTTIEVPQTNHFVFHERFRWPTDQVLLISMGLVAEPLATTTKTLAASLPLGLGGGTTRADLLVMVEGKPQESPHPTSGIQEPLREAKTYRGRY